MVLIDLSFSFVKVDVFLKLFLSSGESHQLRVCEGRDKEEKGNKGKE